jgi:5'-3' exonuclease
LVGDTADGIPGIARWGAKSAACVLAEYLHIEHIPDDASKWRCKVRGAPALAGTLAGARPEAELYRELARLRLDVSLTETLDDLRWRGPDVSLLSEFAIRIGDRRLLEQAQTTLAARS